MTESQWASPELFSKGGEGLMNREPGLVSSGGDGLAHSRKGGRRLSLVDSFNGSSMKGSSETGRLVRLESSGVKGTTGLEEPGREEGA